MISKEKTEEEVDWIESGATLGRYLDDMSRVKRRKGGIAALDIGPCNNKTQI